MRYLGQAAGIEAWAELSPRLLRHSSITFALDAAALRDVRTTPAIRPGTTRCCDHVSVQPRPQRGRPSYLAEAWPLLAPLLGLGSQPSRRSACSMKLSSTHTAAALAPSSATSSG